MRPSVVVVRRRRPPSVRPSRPSVAVVRRRRPLSVRPVRPVRPSSSVVVVAYLQIQGRMQIFEKLIKIEVPRSRDYELGIHAKNAAESLGQN